MQLTKRAAVATCYYLSFAAYGKMAWCRCIDRDVIWKRWNKTWIRVR